jgi:hypothetical protein
LVVLSKEAFQCLNCASGGVGCCDDNINALMLVVCFATFERDSNIVVVFTKGNIRACEDSVFKGSLILEVLRLIYNFSATQEAPVGYCGRCYYIDLVDPLGGSQGQKVVVDINKPL